MEYGEPFDNNPIPMQKSAVQQNPEEIKKIIVSVASKPGNFPGPPTTTCKHSWRRFPMWCHYRDSISRSYCTFCPTVGIFNRFGDSTHYPIDPNIHSLVVRESTWT